MLQHVRTRVVVMSNLERDVCTTTVCVAQSLLIMYIAFKRYYTLNFVPAMKLPCHSR